MRNVRHTTALQDFPLYYESVTEGYVMGSQSKSPIISIEDEFLDANLSENER